MAFEPVEAVQLVEVLKPNLNTQINTPKTVWAVEPVKPVEAVEPLEVVEPNQNT